MRVVCPIVLDEDKNKELPDKRDRFFAHLSLDGELAELFVYWDGRCFHTVFSLEKHLFYEGSFDHWFRIKKDSND